MSTITLQPNVVYNYLIPVRYPGGGGDIYEGSFTLASNTPMTPEINKTFEVHEANTRTGEPFESITEYTVEQTTTKGLFLSYRQVENQKKLIYLPDRQTTHANIEWTTDLYKSFLQLKIKLLEENIRVLEQDKQRHGAAETKH